MKTTIKILALILALVMMLPLVLACKDNSTSEGGADSTTAQQGGPDGTVDTSDQAVSKLPSMDWNGETFDILGRDGGSYVMFHNFEIWRESMPGDVVGDAVFTRNETLKKKSTVKATIFPVVMYGRESWTIKKAEHQRTDALELQCWIRLLRVPWTTRRPNQSILKQIVVV